MTNKTLLKFTVGLVLFGGCASTVYAHVVAGSSLVEDPIIPNQFELPVGLYSDSSFVVAHLSDEPRDCPVIVEITLSKIDPGDPEPNTVAKVEQTGGTADAPLFVVTPIRPGSIQINITWAHAPYEMDPQDPCYQAHDQGFQTNGSGVIILTIPEPPPPEKHSAGNFLEQALLADPISTRDGELVIEEPADLRVQAPVPIQFKRYYGSNLEFANVIGRMGRNWRHNYEWSLQIDGSSATLLELKRCR